ncbi:hypothetical protein TYRP_023171 [Tyrophagus putrescentiae]|nr:hypothetical protein TYRP_023171 [Tyrophagus putrescentiae]
MSREKDFVIDDSAKERLVSSKRAFILTRFHHHHRHHSTTRRDDGVSPAAAALSRLSWPSVTAHSIGVNRFLENCFALFGGVKVVDGHGKAGPGDLGVDEASSEKHWLNWRHFVAQHDLGFETKQDKAFGLFLRDSFYETVSKCIDNFAVSHDLDTAAMEILR